MQRTSPLLHSGQAATVSCQARAANAFHCPGADAATATSVLSGPPRARPTAAAAAPSPTIVAVAAAAEDGPLRALDVQSLDRPSDACTASTTPCSSAVAATAMACSWRPRSTTCRCFPAGVRGIRPSSNNSRLKRPSATPRPGTSKRPQQHASSRKPGVVHGHRSFLSHGI